ncbi:hypothetical protein KOW79_013640 [Hemibagrus wyckioides]|uniref:Major intrinsically disordered Notch2-binding receptor 1-like C-terminal domain-containing protein n=1 Tax=Hemibagrus wyckioides TaxID=337641 RepID=A0A9D3SKB0_9TELE|nr:hypothetical protein KOW79_013640 [Hemibagrus wyckioides]
MDITVLPNNNHPEKFLQLDVGMLPATHGMFQIGAALSGQRQWHNRVYSQGEQRRKKEEEAERPTSPEDMYNFRDSELEQHITPLTLKPKIKQNPLYVDLRTVDMEENQRAKPSWTIDDYDRHSLHGNLANYLQVQSGIICSVTQKIVNKR